MAKETQPAFVHVSGYVPIALDTRLSALRYRLRTLRAWDSQRTFEEVLEAGLKAVENDSTPLDFSPVSLDQIDPDSIGKPDWAC